MYYVVKMLVAVKAETIGSVMYTATVSQCQDSRDLIV